LKIQYLDLLLFQEYCPILKLQQNKNSLNFLFFCILNLNLNLDYRKKILFSSNFQAKAGFPFNIYMIDLDGKNLKQVSFDKMFDSFPVFSNDGKYLIFSSNRNNGGNRDTNIFIAEWQD